MIRLLSLVRPQTYALIHQSASMFIRSYDSNHPLEFGTRNYKLADCLGTLMLDQTDLEEWRFPLRFFFGKFPNIKTVCVESGRSVTLSKFSKLPQQTNKLTNQKIRILENELLRSLITRANENRLSLQRELNAQPNLPIGRIDSSRTVLPASS